LIRSFVENVTAPARTIDEARNWSGAQRWEFSMVSAQYILRFIDTGREVRRPPLIGMDFLYKHRDAIRIPPQRATGLVTFLVDRFTGSQRDVPRCAVALRVFTPSGKPAVRVRCR
jgi:hypothetical protein